MEGFPTDGTNYEKARWWADNMPTETRAIVYAMLAVADELGRGRDKDDE